MAQAAEVGLATVVEPVAAVAVPTAQILELVGKVAACHTGKGPSHCRAAGLLAQPLCASFLYPFADNQIQQSFGFCGRLYLLYCLHPQIPWAANILADWLEQSYSLNLTHEVDTVMSNVWNIGAAFCNFTIVVTIMKGIFIKMS